MSALAEPCARCRRQEPVLERPPIGGVLGDEIQRRVCAICWQEWQGAEVMVINELRLNFMDPASQEILAAEMRRFLALDDTGPSGEPSA